MLKKVLHLVEESGAELVVMMETLWVGSRDWSKDVLMADSKAGSMVAKLVMQTAVQKVSTEAAAMEMMMAVLLGALLELLLAF